MLRRIAAIDIHKKVLMVVVVKVIGEAKDAIGQALKFECIRFGTPASERARLVEWLKQQGVTEVVMESTAQYWKPIWMDLEPHFAKLHLAQAESNKAPKGRKNDFRDAKRLARRLLCEELRLSFVPGPEQRMWRTLTRSKHQLVRDRVRLQNQVESLLEEMRIKLSSVISDLFGVSGRRILTAISKGETDPVKLAGLGDQRLQCNRQELADALTGSPSQMQVEVLKLFLARLELLDQQIQSLDKLAAERLKIHEDAVIRLAEIPGFGADSAQQIIAEVGADAQVFPSSSGFSSWVGFCPGSNISAGENHSSQCPKGNRFVRCLLTEAAQAAVKKKGSHFQAIFRRFLPKLQYNGAICVVAHRLACVVWKILHDGVRYIEQGMETTPQARKRRAQKLVKALRNLGYRTTITPLVETPTPEPAG
jgi:transposase